jgi:hypothetical protein
MTRRERGAILVAEVVYIAGGVFFATTGCRGVAAICFLMAGLLGLWCWIGRGS